MTEYKHRFIILASQAQQEEANKAAKDWDPDSGGDRTFENICWSCGDGKKPVFAVANTLATDEMRGKIYAALERGDLSTVLDITGREDKAGRDIERLGLRAVELPIEVVVEPATEPIPVIVEEPVEEPVEKKPWYKRLARAVQSAFEWPPDVR